MTRAMQSLTAHVLQRTVELALAEDLGRGDLTTEACIDPSLRGTATVRARQPLVFCGAPIVCEVFRQVDPALQVKSTVDEGSQVVQGAELLTLHGSARSLLMGERVALNFAQRLSAVATLTRRCVDALPPASRTRITDTRKTTPGLRAFERYAVRCGGGHNHREDLGAAVLIKDNHIAACGSIEQAITRARERSPHTARITCEVDTLPQLEQALAAKADIVMLDNFSLEDLKAGVAMVAGRALIEVSGGITQERIPMLAQVGADLISIGALTHSAGSVDLGLDWHGHD